MITLTDFEGRWRITRRIEDRLSGQGRFVGAAHIAPDADGLVYTEDGTLTLAQGGSFAAARRYLWRDVGDEIEVRFSDGRFFHRFALGARPSAAHFCDPDQYDVSYSFADWPDWQARWTVKGPRKDYVMTSNYCPLG